MRRLSPQSFLLPITLLSTLVTAIPTPSTHFEPPTPVRRSLSPSFLNSIYDGEPGKYMYLGGIEISAAHPVPTALSITDLNQRGSSITVNCPINYFLQNASSPDSWSAWAAVELESQRKWGVETTRADLPDGALDTWIPCDVSSFQYQIVRFQSPLWFGIVVGHTISKNGTTVIRQATYNWNCPFPTCQILAMRLDVTEVPAPAGWVGDKGF